MKDEVDILGSPSLIVRTVAVDVKQPWNRIFKIIFLIRFVLLAARNGMLGLTLSLPEQKVFLIQFPPDLSLEKAKLETAKLTKTAASNNFVPRKMLPFKQQIIRCPVCILYRLVDTFFASDIL